METKQLKVLLIEGQSKVADEIKKELQALDYKVSTAINTENGLHRAKAFEFDFFVVNSGPDGKDGLNFAHTLMKEPAYSQTPFLFTFNPKLKVDIRLRKYSHRFDLMRLPLDATEFRIRVERLLSEDQVQAPKAADKTSKKQSEAAPEKKSKVLLVEDNPLNQKVLGMFISKLGFEYDVASNGQMAINLSNKEQYGFILMDIYMPEMDGTEATMKIREEEEKGTHRAKIIAITANESEESVRRCYDSGMDDFLVKPFTMDVLKEKLV
ncbi:MAG: response regulator [Prolixibacteraceae bacterium]|nr:response regulator [Prolixibacteraceae bacterium]